jgi:hypothetical protein
MQAAINGQAESVGKVQRLSIHDHRIVGWRLRQEGGDSKRTVG